MVKVAATTGDTTEGYTVDDLRWLRNEIRLAARLELDPWGSLIVSPTDDKHEIAAIALNRQAVEQLSHDVRSTGWAGSFPAERGTSWSPISWSWRRGGRG